MCWFHDHIKVVNTLPGPVSKRVMLRLKFDFNITVTYRSNLGSSTKTRLDLRNIHMSTGELDGFVPAGSLWR